MFARSADELAERHVILAVVAGVFQAEYMVISSSVSDVSKGAGFEFSQTFLKPLIGMSGVRFAAFVMENKPIIHDCEEGYSHVTMILIFQQKGEIPT